MWYGENVIAVRYKWLACLLMFASNAFAQSTHIFISFSIPKTSIAQWLEQAEKSNAVVHLRGFVNNSFKQTVMAAEGLVKKDNHGGFLIDPKMFEQYKIEKVPAVVFVEDDQNHTVIYGDVGLKAAAEIAMTRSDSKVAKEVLSSLHVT